MLLRLAKPGDSTTRLPDEEGGSEQLAMSVERLVDFLLRNIEPLGNGRGLQIDSHGQSIKKRAFTLYEKGSIV